MHRLVDRKPTQTGAPEGALCTATIEQGIEIPTVWNVVQVE